MRFVVGLVEGADPDGFPLRESAGGASTVNSADTRQAWVKMHIILAERRRQGQKPMFLVVFFFSMSVRIYHIGPSQVRTSLHKAHKSKKAHGLKSKIRFLYFCCSCMSRSLGHCFPT